MNKRILNLRVQVGMAVTALTLTLAVTGCSSDDNGSAGGNGGCDDTINIARVSGWNDHTILAFAFQQVLEEHGYDVELQEFGDIPLVYTAVATGNDLDLMFGMPERTQKDHWDKYENELEDLGAYDELSYFFGVPDYVDDSIQSIEDLPAHASEFDGKVFGIEAGTGYMKLAKEKVFPDYGLGDDYELVLSSVTGMLAELRKATKAEEPVVVTTWTPYWVNQAYSVRPLADPKGLLGEPEGLHTLARKDFSKDCPKVADMISSVKLNDEQFASAEEAIGNTEPGDEDKTIAKWLDENPDLVASLEEHLKD